ncbi:MAG: hypothetical protein M0Q21_02220 [Ignavibacteriaceae bacterium]|nr:hypothetical protein [Ignavibacteriaceae bacterium]
MKQINYSMKKYFRHSILLLLTAYFFGCGKPGPTELVNDIPNDEAPLQIEVLAKNPDDALYKGAYDSTGLLNQMPQAETFLFISKNVVSEKFLSIEYNVAQVLFFDRDKPFHLPDGKDFGFLMKRVIPPKINSVRTKEVNHSIQHGRGPSVKDTVLGPKYMLSRTGNFGDSLFLTYNTQVKFEFRKEMMSPPIEFTVKMPEQIIGKVTVTQNSNGEKILLLEWNKGTNDSVEIIIGGKIKNEKTATAFFKLHVNDNGQVKISPKLMKAIPKDRFDRLVFSFVRKAITRRVEQSLEFFTVIQNTHSIIIDYP